MVGGAQSPRRSGLRPPALDDSGAGRAPSIPCGLSTTPWPLANPSGETEVLSREASCLESQRPGSQHRARTEHPALTTESGSDDAGPGTLLQYLQSLPKSGSLLVLGDILSLASLSSSQGSMLGHNNPRALGVEETVFSCLSLAVRASQKTDLGGSTELKIHGRGPPRPGPGLLPPRHYFLE